MTSAADTIAIIQRYNEVLERLQPGPHELFDDSTLDDPRSTIEAALVEALRGDFDHPFAPSDIQGWLASLAQFQPGVGDPILEPASEVARRMAQARARGERPDTVAIQRSVDEAAKAEHWLTRRAMHSADVAQDRTRLLGLLANE